MAFETLIAAVIGASIAAAAAYGVWIAGTRERNDHRFLVEALALMAMKDAWIAENWGPGRRALSRAPKLSTDIHAAEPWLRNVEVRAVLDQPAWNTPGDGERETVPPRFYGFLEGRRAWIVRDEVTEEQEYEEGNQMPDARVPAYPALLSSRALEEMCGWIERVADAYFHFPRLVSGHGLEALSVLLRGITYKRRRDLLSRRLSKKAYRFLEKYDASNYGARFKKVQEDA